MPVAKGRSLLRDKTMNVWEIIVIDIATFFVTYKLWLRAEGFDKDGEISRLEAIFVAMLSTALVTAYMIM